MGRSATRRYDGASPASRHNLATSASISASLLPMAARTKPVCRGSGGRQNRAGQSRRLIIRPRWPAQMAPPLRPGISIVDAA